MEREGARKNVSTSIQKRVHRACCNAKHVTISAARRNKRHFRVLAGLQIGCVKWHADWGTTARNSTCPDSCLGGAITNYFLDYTVKSIPSPLLMKQ